MRFALFCFDLAMHLNVCVYRIYIFGLFYFISFVFQFVISWPYRDREKERLCTAVLLPFLFAWILF